MNVVLSGIQPTNKITIGNYLGSVKHIIELQQNHKVFLFVADLHSMSVEHDKEVFKKNHDNLLCSLHALGIDFKKTIIFDQSCVPAHSELFWILLTQCYMGELNRMTQYKDKSLLLKQTNKTISIPVGLFTYPVLMAADLLLYDQDIVVIGSDQKQHVELANDIAIRINKKYGQIFKPFEAYVDKNTCKIMDLKKPEIKMSKSNVDTSGVLFLSDSIEDIKFKIKSAKTDSLNRVKYDLINQPGVSNLLNIYSGLTNEKINDIELKYQNKNYGEFKKDLSDIVCKFFVKFQEEYKKSNKKINLLKTQMKQNANKCVKLSNTKLEKIKVKLGLI